MTPKNTNRRGGDAAARQACLDDRPAKNNQENPRAQAPHKAAYPIVYFDATDNDEFVVRVAHDRDTVTEFGPWASWERAHREFRRIADKLREARERRMS